MTGEADYGLGIDVSSYQGKPSYHRVKAAGYRFVIAKCTEDLGYVNPLYDYTRGEAINNSLAFGAYHFARAKDGNPEGQADHFLAHASLKQWHLLPTLDLEEEGSEGVGMNDLTRFAVAFAGRIYSRARARTMLYTDRNMLESRLRQTPELRSMRLWLADLTLGPARPPDGWGQQLAVHQFDWYGHVAGVVGQVDRDRAVRPLRDLTVKANQ